MVVPVQMIPGLIAALQENFRLYQESFGPPKGTLTELTASAARTCRGARPALQWGREEARDSHPARRPATRSSSPSSGASIRPCAAAR